MNKKDEKYIDDKIREESLSMREYIHNGVIMPVREDIEEIKRHLNLTGTAGGKMPHEMELPAGAEFKQRIPLTPDPPAGHWICRKCGMPRSTECCNSLISTPDPLHVRVAKALGKIVWQEGATGNWFMGDRRTIPENPPVPSYPNDLVAAMGALEEYCRHNDWYFNLNGYFRHDTNYFCTVKQYGSGDTTVKCEKAKSLPQAICEAIVAHAEQK